MKGKTIHINCKRRRRTVYTEKTIMSKEKPRNQLKTKNKKPKPKKKSTLSKATVQQNHNCEYTKSI